eukprot:XP_006573923.1 vacuolar protein sorting-associated protein 32 homolog 2 [Glycine max]
MDHVDGLEMLEKKDYVFAKQKWGRGKSKELARGNNKRGRKIDAVDKTLDEINEQIENMRMIQEALSAPIGEAAYFDEDELEAELEELEAAEFHPATTAPAATLLVPARRPPSRPVPVEDELAALQAELAI